MTRTVWFILGSIYGLVVGVFYASPIDPAPSVHCRPGPGELSHQDEHGLCSITRKGRLVTRYQT
jgi:hypothetical protein